MEKKLERQYIEDHCLLIDSLPFTWLVKTEGPHFCLDMKKSRLKKIKYNFVFGSEPRDKFPVTGYPERILKVDISLNELAELEDESLYPFKNISELDASLNALKNMPDVSIFQQIKVLKLSYNVISSLRWLQHCKALMILNVSHNQIKIIRSMPVLSNLVELHLDSNKLESLDGIQNLSNLKELYVQNNQIRSLLPLSCSLHLCHADMSNNEIYSVQETFQILKVLFRLKQLKLMGNPVAKDKEYINMAKHFTSVEILDNIPLRESSNHQFLQNVRGGRAKDELIETARSAYEEKLQRKRNEAESTIHYLHDRIMDLQEDLKEYEASLQMEMKGYLRYLEAIPQEDVSNIDPNKIDSAMEQQMFTKFWTKWDYGKRTQANIPFSDLKEPDKVLRMAALLLSNSPGSMHSSASSI
ncbi:leucine-rich repeat-containing protein 23-like [Polypterus senegalus]|uniref:leucine-rich repeat-containing protein 23-like n=1 Tax=Polypterus senegalus TaxID=55291 RepID=UPI00196671B9|nr:leucine-rich repeat-containing protein 23-like [Polypterus senegalus]